MPYFNCHLITVKECLLLQLMLCINSDCYSHKKRGVEVRCLVLCVFWEGLFM